MSATGMAGGSRVPVKGWRMELMDDMFRVWDIFLLGTSAGLLLVNIVFLDGLRRYQ